MATKYDELLSEYKTALSFWSEAKTLFPPHDPQVIIAAEHVASYERKIGAYKPVKVIDKEVACSD